MHLKWSPINTIFAYDLGPRLTFYSESIYTVVVSFEEGKFCILVLDIPLFCNLLGSILEKKIIMWL